MSIYRNSGIKPPHTPWKIQGIAFAMSFFIGTPIYFFLVLPATISWVLFAKICRPVIPYLQKIPGSRYLIAPPTKASDDLPVYTKAAMPLNPRDARKYDAIVYGATGFTGRLLAMHFTRTYGLGKSLTWAIGGRSHSKLQAIKNELITIDPAMKNLDLVIADSGNFEQLSEMCNQTRVVMSTVGPYVLYGTLLVNACALYGTDYADITGEVDWWRENTRKFQNMAVSTGARIMSLCGHDSIPWDLTTFMVHDRLMTKHGERLESIEYFNEIRGAFSGGSLATLFEVTQRGSFGVKNIGRTEDPFYCVPGKNKGNGYRLQNDNCKLINYDFKRGVWTGFALMATINVLVVEKSNCMLCYKDGLSYSEATVFPSPMMGYVMYLF
jgi:short subunit dehydrogenase-like uncharacterized protein